MNTVRTFAFAAIFLGIFFISGRSVPHAAGQAPPRTTPLAPPGQAPIGSGTPENHVGQNASFYGVWGMAPAMASNRTQSVQLARQFAKATKEDEKKEIRKKLADVLDNEFEQLAQQQQTEIDDLEKQVANLKAILKKRKDSKVTIVDRRLEQLIQEAEGLGWGTPGRADHFQQPKTATYSHEIGATR
jgi:hypothetical protein